MRELELIAKLANALKQDKGREYAVLLSSAWTPLAVGWHPSAETGTTAHSAIVNILQNHDGVSSTCKLLVTYAPTKMCNGMLNNFKSSDGFGVTNIEVFSSTGDELDRGAELDVQGLDVSSTANLLNTVKKLKGDAGGVFKQFSSAPVFDKRRNIPAPYRTLLTKLPLSVSSRTMVDPGFAKDTFMTLAFSLVALTWHDKARHPTKHLKKEAQQKVMGGNNVGAVIVQGNRIISWGINVGWQHVTLHAETLAIQSYLERTGEQTLPPGCVIYSSLQPCHMCAGFIAQAGKGAKVVYGMKDNLLKTCLEGDEQPWNSKLSQSLIQGFNNAKGSEQGPSTKFLRGDDVRGEFMPALEKLTRQVSDVPAEEDLLMYCRELLLIAAEQGLATDEGFTHLRKWVKTQGDTLVKNRNRRGNALADDLVREQKNQAQVHVDEAEQGLNKARQLHREAEQLQKNITEQEKSAAKASKQAEQSRVSAEEKAKTQEARLDAESALKFAEEAERAWLNATSLKKKLEVGASEAREHAEAARENARIAGNIYKTTQDGANRIEKDANQPLVFFLPAHTGNASEFATKATGISNMVKKAGEFADEVEACLEKISKVSRDVQVKVNEIEQLKRNAESQAQKAELAVSRKKLLSDFHHYKEDTFAKIKEGTEKDLTLTKTQVDQAEGLLKETRELIEGYTSPIARQEALKSLGLIEQGVKQAQADYMQVAKAAPLVLRYCNDLAMTLQKLKEASSQSVIEELSNKAKELQVSLNAALQNVGAPKKRMNLNLENLNTHQEQAKAPIHCKGSGCTATLTKVTPSNNRWHECTACKNHYCGSCGYKLSYTQLWPTQSRKCGDSTCQGTTELI